MGVTLTEYDILQAEFLATAALSVFYSWLMSPYLRELWKLKVIWFRKWYAKVKHGRETQDGGSGSGEEETFIEPPS